MTAKGPYSTDERNRLIIRLGACDARVWRLKELLLEFVAIHREEVSSGDEVVDRILRLERLCLESTVVLASIPDVLVIPRNSATGPDGDGEVPDRPVAG